MMESQRSRRKRIYSGSGFEFALLAFLFAASLGVRWLYARAGAFPPTDAAAFYLTTAENAIQGRGLEIDVIGSYEIAFPSVTHPSHEYWMPLTTGLVAAALAVQKAATGALDSSPQIGQMAGLLLGSLLAPLTYRFGRSALPQGRSNRWVSLGAALLIAVNATLSYQSASVDSSAPFALIAAGALAIAVRRPGQPGGYLGAGLLVALAYLTRADALLLLVAIPLAWWLLPMPSRPAVEIPDTPTGRLAWEQWPRERGTGEDQPGPVGPGLRHLVDLCVAFALIVAAWLVRNYLAFGAPLPSSYLSQAWLVDAIDRFNYLSHPTLETWLAQPWSVLVHQRTWALAQNGRVLTGAFPWAVLALPGMWLLRRESLFYPSLVYGFFLYIGMALVFPIPATSGTFYHCIGAVMPFLALAAIYTVERGASLLKRRGKLARFVSVLLTVLLLVLSGWQVVQSLPEVREHHLTEQAQFEAVAAWLARNAELGAVVMADRPHSLNYSSGHPTVVLPGNEPPDAVWQAAKRYDARYLIVTQPFGLYPEILMSHPDPRFRLLEDIEGSQIYKIEGG